MADDFQKSISEGYGFQGPKLLLGAPLRDGKVVAASTTIGIPLAMMNRHGLIAGATGTGKTKTLQSLAGQLSTAGVPSFLADLKGDLSGLAAPGVTNPNVEERARACGIAFTPEAYPVEFVSLTGKSGNQLRATVSSFGPLLLSRALGLNETQQSVMALVFRFCDEKKLLLLDLPDLREVLQYLTGAGSAELKEFGGISTATAGVLLRKIVELEQQGADVFFGEPEFRVEDLLRVDGGRGVLTALELNDIQDRPALFSTFMMWLLASLYRELPEVGDVEKPKLVFFFDEAHLLFDGASKALLDEVEKVVRLIRSKGVGIFFITQSPKDIPADVLGQLGNRVQHALRAFTADDDKALKAAARTFPKTPFYDIEETLTTLGIGDAFITVLSPNGAPTPPFATRLVPPAARMGPLTDGEMAQRLSSSAQVKEYATPIDRESARELLAKRIAATADAVASDADHQASQPAGAATRAGGRAPKPEPSTFEKVINSPLTRTVAGVVARGIMGALLPRRRSTTRSRRSIW